MGTKSTLIQQNLIFAHKVYLDNKSETNKNNFLEAVKGWLILAELVKQKSYFEYLGASDYLGASVGVLIKELKENPISPVFEVKDLMSHFNYYQQYDIALLAAQKNIKILPNYQSLCRYPQINRAQHKKSFSLHLDQIAGMYHYCGHSEQMKALSSISSEDQRAVLRQAIENLKDLPSKAEQDFSEQLEGSEVPDETGAIEKQGIIDYVTQSLLANKEVDQETINDVARWAFEQDKQQNSSDYTEYFICLLDQLPKDKNAKLNAKQSYQYIQAYQSDSRQLASLLNHASPLESEQAKELLEQFLNDNKQAIYEGNVNLLQCFQLLLSHTYQTLTADQSKALLNSEAKHPTTLGTLQYFLQSKLTNGDQDDLNETIKQQVRNGKHYLDNNLMSLVWPDTDIYKPEEQSDYLLNDLANTIRDLSSTIAHCKRDSTQLKYYVRTHLYHLGRFISEASNTRRDVSCINQLIQATMDNLQNMLGIEKPVADPLKRMLDDEILPKLKDQQAESAIALLDKEQIQQLNIDRLNDKQILELIIQASSHSKPEFLKTIREGVSAQPDMFKVYTEQVCCRKIGNILANGEQRINRSELMTQLKQHYPEVLPTPLKIKQTDSSRSMFSNHFLLDAVKQGKNKDIEFIGDILDKKKELFGFSKEDLSSFQMNIKSDLPEFIASALQADKHTEDYPTTQALLNCLKKFDDSKELRLDQLANQFVPNQFVQDKNPRALVAYAFTYFKKQAIKSVVQYPPAHLKKTSKISHNDLIVYSLAEDFPGLAIKELKTLLENIDNEKSYSYQKTRRKLDLISSIEECKPYRDLERDLIIRALNYNKTDLAIATLDYSQNQLTEQQLQILTDHACNRLTDQTTGMNFVRALYNRPIIAEQLNSQNGFDAAKLAINHDDNTLLARVLVNHPELKEMNKNIVDKTPKKQNSANPTGIAYLQAKYMKDDDASKGILDGLEMTHDNQPSLVSQNRYSMANGNSVGPNDNETPGDTYNTRGPTLR